MHVDTRALILEMIPARSPALIAIHSDDGIIHVRSSGNEITKSAIFPREEHIRARTLSLSLSPPAHPRERTSSCIGRVEYRRAVSGIGIFFFYLRKSEEHPYPSRLGLKLHSVTSLGYIATGWSRGIAFPAQPNVTGTGTR